MPELPEVEVTCRGIAPHITHQTMSKAIVRQRQLRWPIPHDFAKMVQGQPIIAVKRRAKYLLLSTTNGTIIIHLGMSGRLKLVPIDLPADKHDHVDLLFNNKTILRYTDPRRFGAILWTKDDPLTHPLLKDLGPEPLEKKFTADYLFAQTKNRRIPVKTFIMTNQIVVGVGNIYANEALFMAGIHPQRPAHLLTYQECEILVKAIKVILKKAIKEGGTTLRDFFNSDGKPGYFQQTLRVYGRHEQPCVVCGQVLQSITQGQRRTVFCGVCQK